MIFYLHKKRSRIFWVVSEVGKNHLSILFFWLCVFFLFFFLCFPFEILTDSGPAYIFFME